jgi:hypothetical protein
VIWGVLFELSVVGRSDFISMKSVHSGSACPQSAQWPAQ